MRINEVDKKLTQVDLDQLEIFADRIFAKVGIDVEFTRHFLDRVNDDRNVKQITASELTRIFKQECKKWGKPIAQLGPDSEAVLKDLATDLNIPFALRWDSANNELDLIAKTVMRKKDFKTSNKEFAIQSHDYSLDNTQHKRVFESIQQLNENPAIIAVPAVIVTFEMVAYSLAFLTGAALVIDIQQNPGKYNWPLKAMAAAYTASINLVYGKPEEGAMPSQTDLDATLVDKATTQAAIAELPTEIQSTVTASTQVVIDQVNVDADRMMADLKANVDALEIADHYVKSLDNSNLNPDETAAAATALTAQLVASGETALVGEIATALTKVDTDSVDTKYAIADAEAITRAAAVATLAAELAAQTAKDTAATELSDKNLITLATQISAEQSKLASDKFYNDRIDNTAKASDAEAKAFATALALAKATAAKLASDKFYNDRIDNTANASDAEAKAFATALALAKATAIKQASDKFYNDRIDNTANTADAEAKAAAMAKATAAKLASDKFYNDRIDNTANTADAEAKAAAKVTALALTKSQQKAAMAKHSDMQNARINDIASKSDAEALKARLAKLSANQQAAHDAFQNARIDDMAGNSDAAALDRKNTEIALNRAAAEQAAFDAELYALQQTKASNARAEAEAKARAQATAVTTTGQTTHHDTDIVVPGAATSVTTTGQTTHHDTSMTVPAAGAAAIAHAATASGSGNKGTKRTKKKTKWKLGGGSDPEYWDTNLYRWQQKYGTFENTNLIKKYFMINEGGAMPGVGAVHIDEINPTLEALEKSIGIDLKNHVLGSVGKREFSGDIDVALDIKAEELPAFIEALKKNPLVLDIAKSSVIMTKVKIADFDESKTDGRPRTGFVQIDFMPGDPGWMKTYYHSPSDKESKYKGVYRNIMIASMAAVLDRQMSDAKLDDGRAMEERRYMWSPTEGLLRVKRTPVPKKSGEGYTKKNNNETIEGPWKQPDEIAKVLKLDSSTDLNSFESLLTAMKKNWTKEAQAYVIQGFKDNHVIKDIGIPDEIKDEL